jgi:hypothetical protein
MFQEITMSKFQQAFVDCDRTDQFSRQGLEIIYEWLTELEGSTEQPIELDVIGICCDFVESEPADIAQNYGIEVDDPSDEDDVAYAVRRYLVKEGCLVGETDTGFVHQSH